MKRTVQKGLSWLLSICIVVMMLPMTSLAAYSDVQGHWAEKSIEKWSSLGILQGSDGSFRPNDPITRGEMAVIIDRIMQYQTSSKNVFADLGEAFYTNAVLKANAAGVIKGDAATIRPTDNMTREEAAVMIGRTLGIAENVKAGNAFSDGSAISSWALGYINVMSSKGILNGSDGKFNPKSSITRAEIVTILDNAISELCTEATEYTGNVTGTVIINAPGVALADMKITGDLIISEGVGSGDVTLDNVTVTGNTIVRGGGANSIHIKGGSQISNIIVEKTDSGDIRVVTSEGAVIDAVYVDDGSDDVILTGSFQSLTIAANVTVKAVGASIDTINLTAEDSSLDVDKKSSVTSLNVSETATGANVTVSGNVKTLTTDAQITVDNQGTISKAVVNANNVIIDGKEPTKVTVDSSVTKLPKDSDGNKVDGSTGSSSSGGSTSSNTSFSVSVTKLATVNQADGNTAVSQQNQDIVTVSKSSNTVTVTGSLANLNSFESTNVSQGTHKWVGLVVDTGESSIIGVSYNGTAFTQSDVNDAASVNVGAGKFVLWIKADEVVSTPKTFTLSKSGRTTITITVAFKVPVTAIAEITGTERIGSELTAGAVTPADATVTYQWQRCDAVDGTYSNITGATSSAYTLTLSDLGKYIKVAVTGTGTYTGTATSNATAAVAKAAAPAAPAGSIAGTYPVAADSINLTGLGASTTGLEAAVAINGTNYDTYVSLTVDASGNATISGLTSVT
ncbi:MAG: S-layer homology domain-containing protein, partial [Clostridiaceae bacterium]|nr:S-layer homology domain-containing protein [Clostridiaceae bacterium]